MKIKATLRDFFITEVPTTLFPDGRSRPPHLHSWHDGWRHLRFMLLYYPDWLFVILGFTLLCLGFLLLLALVSGPIRIGLLLFDTHYMVLGSLLTLLGFQVLSLGIYAKTYALTGRFEERNTLIKRLLKWFNLERGSVLGLFILLIGLIINLIILFQWTFSGFGDQHRLREAILAMTLMVIGVQIVFSSFFLSILGIRKKK